MKWQRVAAVAAVLLLAGSLFAPAADQAVLELIQTIPLKGKPGKLDHLIVDSKGERLFLANKVNNTIDVVDLKAGKPVFQIKSQSGVQGLAYAADLNRLYAGLGTGGSSSIPSGGVCVERATRELGKQLKNLAAEALETSAGDLEIGNGVRYDPRTHTIYVAHAEKALGVIDGQTLEQKADIDLPGSAEGFEVDSSRPRLYLSMPNPCEVVEIDTDKNTILQHYPIKMAGAAHPLALDEAMQENRIQPGNLVTMCGFGAGLAWGTALMRW